MESIRWTTSVHRFRLAIMNHQMPIEDNQSQVTMLLRDPAIKVESFCATAGCPEDDDCRDARHAYVKSSERNETRQVVPQEALPSSEHTPGKTTMWKATRRSLSADAETFCSITNNHESMELDLWGLCYMLADGGEDSSETNDSYYSETSDGMDSLDYSSSLSHDVWKLHDHRKVRDEKYLTEGFVDVGELPRVS